MLATESESRLTVGVFHPGTQHSWQTALAFQEAGNLGWYATSVFYNPDGFPYRLAKLVPGKLGSKLNRQLERRYHADLDQRRVRTFGMAEWAETGLRHLGADWLAAAVDLVGNDLFGHRVARLIKEQPVSAIWGFNNASAVAFREAKKRGIKCILDQTIGHPLPLSQSMQRQYVAYPEFFRIAPEREPGARVSRNNEELMLADVIVVGSEFCASTIPSEFQSRIQIVPYGHSIGSGETTPRQRGPGIPEFIFVGTVQARKGIPQLLEAFCLLEDKANLTIVGPIDIPRTTLERFAKRRNIKFVGGIPRSEVEGYLRQADYFVFPSLFEGGGIVLYEAAAAGLPIVQSANCGDGCNGSNGIVLRSVSMADICEAVEKLLAQTPAEYSAASRESLRLAESRKWSDYRATVRLVAAESLCGDLQ